MSKDRDPAVHRPVEAGIAASAHARRQDAAAAPRVVNSDSLLAGASQVAILHNETVYLLRQTRFGKLILTK
jgi:hemin uptake protein HemP